MSIRRDAFVMVEPYRGVWECKLCKEHIDVDRSMQIEALTNHYKAHQGRRTTKTEALEELNRVSREVGEVD